MIFGGSEGAREHVHELVLCLDVCGDDGKINQNSRNRPYTDYL